MRRTGRKVKGKLRRPVRRFLLLVTVVVLVIVARDGQDADRLTRLLHLDHEIAGIESRDVGQEGNYGTEAESDGGSPAAELAIRAVDLSSVPEYSGEASVSLRNGQPAFSADTLRTESFEYYSSLDAYGRCGVCVSCIGLDRMPDKERESIGMIRPSGWHTVRYDGIDGKYLYNRCHLIGYQLTGENSNERNLITGTRYLNTVGMLPFENQVAEYIKRTGNHVLYRVTPDFQGSNLLASGVCIEAESVEDAGAGIRFCVYCYNVQPGIRIRYADGSSEPDPASALSSGSGAESKETGETVQGTGSAGKTGGAAGNTQTSGSAAGTLAAQTAEPSQGTGDGAKPSPAQTPASDTETADYVLNLHSRRFHVPDCDSIRRMHEKNRKYYTGDRQTLIDQGFVPCQNCNP